ncbi:S41 family peptidase [Rufibacter immobilis]|uniref:S41 family peptidase n=1 Tax=Rufibacter immobilis TaxID=1348778 RepID=UPI0035E766BC
MSGLLVCVAFLFSPFAGQAQILYAQPTDSSLVTTRFTKAQVQEDLGFLLHTLQQAHPNLYHSVSRKQLTRYKDSVEAALPAHLSSFQVSFALSAVVAQLNEGHLGFVTHQEQWKHFYREAQVFPFTIAEVMHDALIIQKDLSQPQHLAPFDTIWAINGIPVRHLIQKYKNLNGGLDCWRTRHVNNNLHFLLFADSIRSPFQVRASHQGRFTHFTVEGNPYPKPSPSGSTVSSPAYYTYQVLPDSVAYLNFRRMWGYHSRFISFLDSAFTDMHVRGVQKLVIDLRYNGGGDPRLGQILLSYLTRKPYRFHAFTKFKLSKPSKEFQYDLVNSTIPKPVRVLLKSLPNGLVKTTRYKAKPHRTKQPFYTGQFCFLIGQGTFSAANNLAGSIKEYGLGTLIGEATCEPLNDYGEMMSFMLPHTRLVASTPSEYFTHPTGDRHNRDGVQPDVVVKPTQRDRAQGRDAVLEFAQRWFP